MLIAQVIGDSDLQPPPQSPSTLALAPVAKDVIVPPKLLSVGGLRSRLCTKAISRQVSAKPIAPMAIANPT